MARTTVSIPDDLRRRMKAVTESVNWSAVAARAFEAKLAEINKRRRVRDMDAVIQRLRASRLSGEDEDRRAGFGAGQQWAETKAEWQELERLGSALGDFEIWEGIPDNFGWRGVVFRAINPAGFEHIVPSDQDIEEFWEMRGSADPSLDWLQGFCDGAMAVCDQVRDQVEG